MRGMIPRRRHPSPIGLDTVAAIEHVVITVEDVTFW
jgi:hypothetical protein